MCDLFLFALFSIGQFKIEGDLLKKDTFTILII